MKIKSVFVVALTALLMSSCAKEDLTMQSTDTVENETQALSIQAELADLDAQFLGFQDSKKVKASIDMAEFEALADKEAQIIDEVLDSKMAIPGTIINVPGDYATIQAAVDAAQPGEWVQVSAGTYVEDIEINNKNNIRLTSDGGLVTIDGRIRLTSSSNILIGRLKILPGTELWAIRMMDGPFPGMRFIRNEIEFNEGSNFFSYGFEVEGDMHVFKNNTVIADGDPVEYGIQSIGDNCLMKGNMCTGLQGPGNSSGILVSGVNNVVRRNFCTGFAEGVRVNGGSDNTTVTDNICNDNTKYGIIVFGTNTSVTNNTALNNVVCDIWASSGGFAAGSTESGNTANCIQGF